MSKLIVYQADSIMYEQGVGTQHELSDDNYDKMDGLGGALEVIARDIADLREDLINDIKREEEDYNDSGDIEVTIVVLEADDKLLSDALNTEDATCVGRANLAIDDYLYGDGKPSEEYPNTELLKKIKFTMK